MADSAHSVSGNKCLDSRANVPEKRSRELEIMEFSEDEEALVIRMYNLVGKRWSLIAGRIPGRTAEEIEKFWNSRMNESRDPNA